MATSVLIGSAHIDEHGNARGGQAGDQTGKEISTQKWYLHDKGWVCIRAKDATVREKIAQAMQAACDNDKIGYDQSQRDTLYTVAQKVGFDVSKVTTACETDCSALVRVCCAFAGIKVASFRTYNEVKTLTATGHFASTTSPKYTTCPDYLLRGDILCTRESGHTVVVMNNGAKATVPDQQPAAAQPEQKPKQTKQTGTTTIRTWLYAKPPTTADDEYLDAGQTVEIWGTSIANPDYLAVKLPDGRKGYISKDSIGE